MSVKVTSDELFPCESIAWLWMPVWCRRVVAWITLIAFSVSFLIVPLSAVFLTPWIWKFAPYLSTMWMTVIFISMMWPMIEWPTARKIGQLWYEVFRFSCNLSPEVQSKLIQEGDSAQYAIAMHPHGIVPFQAILWAAYCDQYLSDPVSGKALYGFGAAADVIMYLPVLRNIMGWLSAGSASYKTLKDGLTKGISGCVNAAGRKPRHLYLLPGGVAEVFTSTLGKNAIIFKDRKGLIKLSLETGVYLCPTYVFGGTDFFHNLATHSGFFSQISRSLRMGITIFWGQFGLPIPFAPKVTMCIADPLVVEKWCGEGPVPSELIDQLHARYIKSIQDLFEKYKVQAGYPNSKLEIM